MAVVNLAPGAIYNVAANQIAGNAHVYRTRDGYDGHGTVGWLPTGGALQQQDIAIGETVTFAINGQAGAIISGAPSRLQLLYSNGAAIEVAATDLRAGQRLLHRGGSRNAPARRATAVGDNPGQQAMQTLTAQWYNALTAACQLDPSTFQLVQGHSPLGATSEILSNLFDSVPPQSINNLFNPSQGNVFSTDYGAVINNLKAQNANKFMNDIGDYYSQWTAYLKTNPAIPQGGISALFDNWSQLHMPPDQAQQCYTDYLQVSQGVVPVAVQMWLAAGGGTGGVNAYNATIAQLQSALQASQGVNFTLNTSQASSDISHTWAKAEGGFLFDLFEIGGDGSYDQLSETVTEAGLDITVSFQRLVTFPAGPLAKVSSDPILSNYQPWYSSAALNLAYQNNNNLVWNNTPPTWDNTFGPTGNMLRTASAIVVVDGISITSVSLNSIATKDQTTVKTAVEAGFWPFFEAEGSGGWQNTATFDAAGTMTVTSTCPLGNPQILGVIVTPIGGLLLSDPT
jgi:hypothetical protein